MKVQEIMTTVVESVRPTTSLRTAARKMRDLNIGSLAVVDEGKILGIVTDRDISCHAVAIGRDPNSTEVQKIMNTDVVTCLKDMEINQAAELMEHRHIRRIAVLDDDAQLAGFLSVDDVARSSHDLAGAILEAATPIH